MAKRMKPVDVVVVGFGWTGSIMSKELSDAGYKVVAFERGRDQATVPNFQAPQMHDELKYGVRLALMENVKRETLTFRNNMSQHALPMRQLGAFVPGVGVGGAGVHWNAQTWRFLPSEFVLRSHYAHRYGKNFIPSDLTIQDWGISYDELEPYYDKMERLCGTSGTAGNLRGDIIPGGNPFEGPRSNPYPTPPMKTSYAGVLFGKAAQEMGYSPFPMPSGNLSEGYTNFYGVRLLPCVYCGFCERYGCSWFAKSSPETTVIPAINDKNFELRTHSHVLRVNLDAQKSRATGVTYIDGKGEEYEQPAELVILSTYAYHNVLLLLLSGIGKAYDPNANEGTVGRNYSFQTFSYSGVYFNKDLPMNPFMGAGALGTTIDDFNGDNFDHGKLGFVGGGWVGTVVSGGAPIMYHPVPPGTPRWGAGWKRAVAENYNHYVQIRVMGSSTTMRGNYLDLDRNYHDAFGRPLLRMTFDFTENDVKMSHYITGKAAEIGRHMPTRVVHPNPRKRPFTITIAQTTHNTGGAAMGSDPNTSVCNKYLQSWDVPNVFVMGASVFPQNAGYNPTGTIGALTFWAANAIKKKYMKNPGPLVRA